MRASRASSLGPFTLGCSGPLGHSWVPSGTLGQPHQQLRAPRVTLHVVWRPGLAAGGLPDGVRDRDRLPRVRRLWQPRHAGERLQAPLEAAPHAGATATSAVAAAGWPRPVAVLLLRLQGEVRAKVQEEADLHVPGPRAHAPPAAPLKQPLPSLQNLTFPLRFVYNLMQVGLCSYMTVEAGILAYRNNYRYFGGAASHSRPLCSLRTQECPTYTHAYSFSEFVSGIRVCI